MKYFALFFILFFAASHSQVLLRYPEGQEAYKGGRIALNKELQEILQKNTPNGCEKDEALALKVMVDEDAKIKLVYEQDTAATSNNKCAYDLAKNALKYTSGWQPATVNNEKVKAIAHLLFAPNDLLKGDLVVTDEETKNAEFPGGITKYREKFMSCFDTRSYRYSGDLRFVINFEINTVGGVQNIFIDSDFDNPGFVDMVTSCVQGPKKIKWKPAEYKGIPVVTQFRLPISIRTN